MGCTMISPPTKTPHFTGGSVVKKSPANARDMGSIPGSGRSPEEGYSNPHQYFCLGNPMDRGAWWVTIYGVTRVRYELGTKPAPKDLTKSTVWSECCGAPVEFTPCAPRAKAAILLLPELPVGSSQALVNNTG